MKEWYKDWFSSPFYHQLYFGRDRHEAEAFIGRLLQHLKPAPGSRMLDVACGRGRHSVQLADRGFEVTGIDLSLESILAAKEWEREGLEFFQHDMRLPFRVNYFDYVFNFFTSFGYFATAREHDDAARTMAAALKPGGTLMIDFLNPHYAEDRLVPHEERTIGETHYAIRRWDDDHHFYKKIIVSDPSVEGAMEFTERVAKLSLGDFTDLLAFQGLQIREVFGDYNLGPYNVRQTPRLIILARKGR